MGLFSDEFEIELYSKICKEQKWICEQLEELGRRFSEYYDTEALYKMYKLLKDYVDKDTERELWFWIYQSEEYWAERYRRQTGDVVYFDFNAMRWRSALTGQFVKDPYEHLYP